MRVTSMLALAGGAAVALLVRSGAAALALGPLVGIVCLVRLRRLPEAARLAGGRR